MDKHFPKICHAFVGAIDSFVAFGENLLLGRQKLPSNKLLATDDRHCGIGEKWLQRAPSFIVQAGCSRDRT